MSTPARTRTVLVTGAARRLGRDIALALASAGWQVAVHYRDSHDEALETAAACAELAGDSAALDAVVNNASLFEHDDAGSFSYVALEAHLRSNTGAPILLAQALHAHIEDRVAAGEEHASGAVINMLDQKLWNQNPDFLSYTLSKAALEAAGTMLALALAPRVRVVGVAPGLTLTSHMLSQERFESLHRLSPLGRSSSAADVAATVCFALDNQSITGTTLLVDGGQHLQRFERDFSMM